MPSFNRVILMGNLVQQPELRYTQSGTAVLDNAIAVNHKHRQEDETVEETTFVDLTFWGRTAEVVAEYLAKGNPLLVEGRLKQEHWETSEQKRSKLKVVVERLQLLGGKPLQQQLAPAAASDDTPF